MLDYTPKSTNAKTGLIFGLIMGFVYCISLYLRFNVASSVIVLAVIAFLCYLIVIGMMIACGIRRRNELGGYIELKDAFQTIFIAILVAELIYTIFNYIYLKYVDPHFFENMQTKMEAFFEKTISDDTKREDALNRMKEQLESQKEALNQPAKIILGYLVSVAISGIFGLIASLIVRKRKPEFELDQPIS